MKKMALFGLLGGVLFAIGDLLVYLLPLYLKAGYPTDVIQMNMWRLAISAYLGCIGSGLLLIGFYSLYQAVKDSCSKAGRKVLFLVAFGITMTPIGHFIVACLSPMIFKCAISSGASISMAKEIAQGCFVYTNPIKYFNMSVVIIFQSVMMAILIVKRKINCPRWMIVLTPFGFTLLISLPLLFLLNKTSFVGITECFESLGEGAIYLPVYCHWKRSLHE